MSWRLTQQLADIYPDSLHVRELGLSDRVDLDVWDHAKRERFVIVSKDTDFQQRSLLFGHPPKVIWLRVGNCKAALILALLRNHSAAIHAFALDETKSYLAIP